MAAVPLFAVICAVGIHLSGIALPESASLAITPQPGRQTQCGYVAKDQASPKTSKVVIINYGYLEYITGRHLLSLAAKYKWNTMFVRGSGWVNLLISDPPDDLVEVLKREAPVDYYNYFVEASPGGETLLSGGQSPKKPRIPLDMSKYDGKRRPPFPLSRVLAEAAKAVGKKYDSYDIKYVPWLYLKPDFQYGTAFELYINYGPRNIKGFVIDKEVFTVDRP